MVVSYRRDEAHSSIPRIVANMLHLRCSKNGGDEPRMLWGSRIAGYLVYPALLGWMVVGLCGGLPRALAQPSHDTASPQQIDQWLAALEDNSFLVREDATVKLIGAGARVIEPVLNRLSSMKTPEAKLRAVFVLKQLALSDDDAVHEAARRAMEHVVALRLGAVSRRAEESLESLYAVRQRRALQELVRLGAKTLPERTYQLDFVSGLQLDNDWQGTDADLRHLRYMVNLTELKFAGEKVRDNWLEYLPAMKELTALSISRANISAAGMKHVAGLANLRILELKYVSVGDDCVDYISRLQALDFVRLYGTAITDAGAERLRQALPLARVDVRAGAFLGISGDHHSLGCLIHTVRPETAASRMGLREGDIIVRYAGRRVGDFEALTALISKNRPGDEVEIHYLRGADVNSARRLRRADDRLGLHTRPHPAGCEIVEVDANSVAAMAGLRPGDVLNRLNGNLVETPAELEQKFAQIPPGEYVNFEFVRGVEVRKTTGILGEWE